MRRETGKGTRVGREEKYKRTWTEAGVEPALKRKGNRSRRRGETDHNDGPVHTGPG